MVSNVWPVSCRVRMTRFGSAVLSASFLISHENQHSNRAAISHNFGKWQHPLDGLPHSIGELIGEGELKHAPRFSSRCFSTKQQSMKFIGPINKILSNVHHVKVHVFSDSLLCCEASVMNDAISKWIERNSENRRTWTFHVASFLEPRQGTS